MCTDEEDIEDLKEMHGPLCWQGYENDHGGFKKLMWYGIMKEFNCKATFTWSTCGRETEMSFTHRQLGERRQERKAQLDYIIGPRWKSDEAYVYNEVNMGLVGSLPDVRDDARG